MKLARAEQETVINFYADEKAATIYTSDTSMIKKLDELVSLFPDQYEIEKETEVSKTYILPKSFIKFMKPRKLSQEQRLKKRIVMHKINQKKIF